MIGLGWHFTHHRLAQPIVELPPLSKWSDGICLVEMRNASPRPWSARMQHEFDYKGDGTCLKLEFL